MNADNKFWDKPAKPLDAVCREQARTRQGELTKPAGSLGRLEELAIFMATAQERDRPVADRVTIAVFVADHGIAIEGVSAFPQAVTAQMVSNLAQGGAAISVIAGTLQANLDIINLGTVFEAPSLSNVRHAVIAKGTASFLRGPAMTGEQFDHAIAVTRAQANGSHLFIGGEVGITNTTSAAAVACALLNESPARLAGPGTGLDDDGLQHKIRIIERALAHHGTALIDTDAILQALGGFEIVALVGAYINCAQQGIPVLIDGYISAVAALAAERLCPGVKDWFIYGHRSAEPGHVRVLAALDGAPLLMLEMRLGEGSGAATAVPLIRLACALHNGMATFAEAEIADRSS